MEVKPVDTREIVKRDAADYTEYVYKDTINKYEVDSKIIFKSINKIIHYPFSAKNGSQKYKNIKQIIYDGMPKDLPAGFLKSPGKGYGFTKELNPLIYAIEKEYPKITKITVSKLRKTQLISEDEIVFSSEDLQNARPRIVKINDKHKTEKETLVYGILASLLPGAFEVKKAKYQEGNLAQYILKNIKSPSQLSDDDVESIFKLIKDLPPEHDYIKSSKIIATKESVDRIFIEDLVAKFEALLNLKTDTKELESKWQDFFSKNILFFNFGYVEKFEKERIQGDKSINIPDFIMLNTYRFLDVFEIKTHLTQLLTYDNGRNNFYWSSDACKAISQAENYIDSIIKEEDLIIKNIRDEYGIANVDAVRPVVHIVASSKARIAGDKTGDYKGKIEKKLWNDFRRLDNSLKNINFILYDEMLEVFRNMLKRLKGEK